MKRSEDYDVIISGKIKTRKGYRKRFLEGLMEGEDGFSLEDSLKIIIRTMGVKEFAKLTKQASPNITDFLKGRRTPKQSTLDTYLKPFGLKTVLAVKEIRKAA